jgi:hypothetical protein
MFCGVECLAISQFCSGWLISYLWRSSKYLQRYVPYLVISVDSVCDVGGKRHLCPWPVMSEHRARQLRRYGLDDGLSDARCVGGSGANLQLECFLLYGVLVYFLGGPQVTLRHLCNLEGMLDSAFVCPPISFFWKLDQWSWIGQVVKISVTRFQGTGIWEMLHNLLYGHPWVIPETTHTYLISKPNYFTSFLITTSLLFTTHQHGYEKAN